MKILIILLLTTNFLCAQTSDQKKTFKDSLRSLLAKEEPYKKEPITLKGDTFLNCEEQLLGQKLKTVVGVDHYGSGNRLVEMFEHLGYKFLHIESNPTHPTIYTHAIEKFRSAFKINYIYDKDWDKMISMLEEQDIAFVLAGSESGVLLADKIAERFNTVHNDTQYSELKRNKYLMNEALRDAGLDAVKQKLTADVNEALEWVTENTEYPVIVKPYDGCGTVGVKKCMSPTEVRKHFKKALSSKGVYNKIPDKLLIQEYLEGPEFVHNTVGQGGRHMTSDIWEYVKKHQKGATDIYDLDKLHPYEGDFQSQIIPYALAALKAIHLDEGASHMELKLVPGRGPVMIEVGARMMGSDMPHQSSPALLEGRNQLDLMVIKYDHPERFEEMLDNYEGYHLRKNMIFVTVNSHTSGLRFSAKDFNQVKELPSYVDSWAKYKDGEKVHKTIDMETQVAEIILAHESREQLEEDYQKIRKWEKKKFLQKEYYIFKLFKKIFKKE
ncbi:MAG: ATP-grasp domain-containing protein [Halobacteriovoraceae bacterium]|nr:ATP-grasp domain-containing protein [Halobacteriovoraceae bacterium]